MTLEFLIYAVLLLASASGVVGFHNPIRSGLCLIVNLLTVAAMFASLGAHFLAATQIIVYAGAIVVLVIFVLMLLNVKDEAFSSRDRRVTIAGLVVSLLLLGLIVPTVRDLGDYFSTENAPEIAEGAEVAGNEVVEKSGSGNQTAVQGGVVRGGVVRDGAVTDGAVKDGAVKDGAVKDGTVKDLGREVYTKYVFPFEAASVLIMAALVGAVMLAKRGDSTEA